MTARKWGAHNRPTAGAQRGGDGGDGWTASDEQRRAAHDTESPYARRFRRARNARHGADGHGHRFGRTGGNAALLRGRARLAAVAEPDAQDA